MQSQVDAHLIKIEPNLKWTHFAMMTPRAVRLKSPNPRTSSCLWPKAASRRTASTWTSPLSIASPSAPVRNSRFGHMRLDISAISPGDEGKGNVQCYGHG